MAKDTAYHVDLTFGDGQSASFTIESLPLVLECLKRLDQEGCSWSVFLLRDITEEVQEVYHP